MTDDKCALALTKNFGVYVIRYSYKFTDEGIDYFIPVNPDDTHYIFDSNKKILRVVLNNDTTKSYKCPKVLYQKVETKSSLEVPNYSNGTTSPWKYTPIVTC